jgi:hypothetical protein
MENSAKDILQAHPEYERNKANYKFLYDSYRGGKSYKEGGYLTRYVYETEQDYLQRAVETPVDLHCQSIVDIYNSFLFAEPPVRDFGSLANNPVLDAILEDADYDDRSFDDFMSEADRISAIFGSAWIIADKPAVDASTLAEEYEMGVRPYLCLFNPLMVLDWKWSRQYNGAYALTYLKVIENLENTEYVIKVFTPEMISTYIVDEDTNTSSLVQETPNALGYIPAVCLYDTRSHIKGVGISAIEGIADLQRSIYNQNSEIAQLIRISNHPSLVKTEEVIASAGAGSIISMPDNMDPGLKPYLLQPNSGSLDAIRANISDTVDAINRLANVGSIRVLESRTLSGVALDTEFRLLGARLAKKADQLQLAEEQIWQIICDWLNIVWDGKIEYPSSYNTRDTQNEMNSFKTAQELLPGNRGLQTVITRRVAELLTDDYEEMELIIESPTQENTDV